MKNYILLFLTGIILTSCTEKSHEESKEAAKVKPIPYLPFQDIVLNNLEAFKEVPKNWKIAADVMVDPSKAGMISVTEGTGVLINIPTDDMKGHLFTTFEHGDIELELDVMMPKGSNSGLYFQGRYEVQLFDSWGVENPQHSDMGGIYQRWDDTQEDGNQGFEGISPNRNAAKAPGLWQHLRIIFHAPEFDGSGNKIDNARFVEIWLNGMLIHENVEISGPTRAAAFEIEEPLGPLMIQGDHGPVALKNIRYKLYDDTKVSLSAMRMIEYENTSVQLPNLGSLVPLRDIPVDSISAKMVSGERTQRILTFSGQMIIPQAGAYLFNFKVNRGGGLLMVDRDTIVDLDGDYTLDSLGLGKVELQKGTVPFTLIYNKHRAWAEGFSLEVEGPNIQKQALQATYSLDLSGGKPLESLMVKVDDSPVHQRSFLMHNGEKRTHCISVGTPKGIHYAYDLALGSLLKAWDGDFLDVTPMWHERGEKQLGVPAGFTVTFHGNAQFALLENEQSNWPEDIPEETDYKSLGYEIDGAGMPSFQYAINNSTLIDRLVPSDSLRSLKRSIVVRGNQEIWHKVAEGESIKKLPEGTYIVNDESYFIDFSEDSGLNPKVRESEGKEELLVKIPTGEQKIEYNIIW